MPPCGLLVYARSPPGRQKTKPLSFASYRFHPWRLVAHNKLCLNNEAVGGKRHRRSGASVHCSLRSQHSATYKVRSLSDFYDERSKNRTEVTGILNNGDISNERSEEKSLRAGGRSGILLKAKPSGCLAEEARRRMPGDPAGQHYIRRLSRKRFKRSTPKGAQKSIFYKQ